MVFVGGPLSPEVVAGSDSSMLKPAMSAERSSMMAWFDNVVEIRMLSRSGGVVASRVVAT